MSKEQNKGNMSTARAKKGSVRNRAANRTVPEGFAKSEPKYDNVGNGVLVRRTAQGAHGPHSNPIHLVGPTGFASVSYRQETPAEEQVWQKVGVVVPAPPPSAAGLTSVEV